MFGMTAKLAKVPHYKNSHSYMWSEPHRLDHLGAIELSRLLGD